MHNDACTRVTDLIEPLLLKSIETLKGLTGGTSGDGYKVKVHTLPDKPNDITDDGDFHYAVLGPRAMSSSGNPGAEARRFLDETTGPDRPRVYRNAVVLAVPSREGLEVARNRIREYLGWEEVQSQLKGKEVDLVRREKLRINLEEARKEVPRAVQQAYNVVVTVAEDNQVQAFKLNLDATRPLFDQIKSETRSRVQETAISYEALLPEGPYDLWRSGETSRRVKDLVGAFAQFPHLPKMLNRQAIQETIIQGCREGQFVLRVTRPDRSTRTIWRQEPDESDLKNTTMEVVLPEATELSAIEPALLAPGVLPGLWAGEGVSVSEVRAYFSGGKVVQVPREGYAEPVTIPKAPPPVVDEAITWSVREGKLWLTSGPTSLYSEDVPAGLLTGEALLQPPPAPLAATDVLPEDLPDAWDGEVTSAHAITEALSSRAGSPLPWATVRVAIDAAFQGRLLERTEDCGPWPCDYAGSPKVLVRVPASKPVGTVKPKVETPQPPAGVLTASAYLNPGEVQDLADQIGGISGMAVGYDLKVMVRVEVGSDGKRPPEDLVAKINAKLGEVSQGLKLS